LTVFLHSCNGGHPVIALQGMSKIANASAYPFKGSQGTCKTMSAKNLYNVPEWTYSFGDEDLLKYLLDELKNSVAVAVHVNDKFQNYRSGIFDDSSCPNAYDKMNHAVNGKKSIMCFDRFQGNNQF
jgi:hypothetical protein